MNIGDRYHLAPGTSSVVVIREIQDNGLVMVENETPGTGVYPYLITPEHFIPATTAPPTPVAHDETAEHQPGQSTTAADDSYLDELNAT